MIFTDILKTIIVYYIGFIIHEISHIIAIKLRGYKVTGAIIILFARRRRIRYGLKIGLFFFPPPTKRDAKIIAISGTVGEIIFYTIIIATRFIRTILPALFLIIMSLLYLVKHELPRTIKVWEHTPGELYYFETVIKKQISGIN